MADISLSFSTENGISLDDLVGIFAGSIDPSITGETAPIGSLFLRQNGTMYQKIGAADTDWIKFSQGLGEAVKITANDTNSGYLDTKIQVSANLTKAIQNANANEDLLLDLSDTGVTAGTYRSVTVDTKGRVTTGTNPTTLSGYGITDAQGLDADLTALANTSSTGLYAITGAGTSSTRTIVGTANQITVLNGSGVAGNPTISLPSTGLTFPGTEGVVLPIGTTAQRVATTGEARFNSDSSAIEYYNGSVWVSLVASTGGTVTSIDAAQPAAGLTITGAPITTSGTLTFALANDLAGLEGLSGTGFSTRTAPDTWQVRTLTGTIDRLTITNGDGIAGDPVFDIASTYAGQSSITTLGVISTGTWQGTTIATQFGGTGRTTIGTANQMLGVNTLGSALEYKTIANGTGIGLNFTAGQIAINNTGVTALAGTANQVSVSAATGSVTLSLPQNIHTAATPTFASVTVASDPTLPLQLATKQYVDGKVQGVVYKTPVRLATTSNINTNGGGNIDGVSINNGDRILVKNQNNAYENGVYIVSPGAWVRSTDLNAWNELYAASVFVEEGDTNANTSWYCTVPETGTLETDPVTWVLFFKSGALIAGTGLTKTGNIISITDIGTPGTYNNVTTNAQGQVISGSNVPYLTGNQNITLQGDVTGSGTTLINTTLTDTGVAAGTYKSVTVDTKGRVTAGTNPTTLAGYGITDAQALNAYLTSLSALATNGIVVRNGNTALARTIIAGSTKVSVADGDGVAGNPSIDVVEANLTLNNIGGTLSLAKGGTNLTAGGTANQILGMNSGASGLEYKTLTAGTGVSIVHGANTVTINANTGTVTSVAVTGSTGLSVSGSPITTSGTITLTLGAELQGLSALSTNGLVTRTAAGTYTSRSVVSGVGTIAITNPAGTAGNIGLDLATIGTAGTYRSVTTDAFGRVTAGTNPTTLAGYGITDAINISEKGAVNGVATLDASGLIPTSQLPPLAINSTSVVASQAAMLALTAQTGDMAVRTDVNRTFVLAAEPASTLSNWVQLADGPSGTVTSVAATQPAAGLTITGSPITNSGTLVFGLANDLAAVEGLSTTGIVVRTAADTWGTRSLVAGTGISLVNADGVSGNITINATNNGTVTSVGIAAPGIFAVTGSPITTSGTITLGLTTQAAGTFFAGPVSGGAALPTFRTVSIDEMSDVVLTAPSTNQVLAYNGSNWVNTGAVGANAAGLVGVGQAGAAAWTLISGSSYRADFAHNLGTTNVVITVFDSTSNAVVIPDLITLTNANTVRIQVTGNTRTLRVVVVANGQSIVAGGSTPSSVILAKDGINVLTGTTKLNFTGQAITVTDAGAGTANIVVGARYSYFPNSLDNPVNSDFAVNALAPTTTDPTYASLNVRSFSNTVEQGVAFTCSIPAGATQMTFKFRGRAQVAQGAAQVVQPRLYARQIPNNTAVGAWSAAQELANIAVPANANFQYAQQTVALSTLGLTADRLYQFELTRRVSGVTGTNLATNFLLAEVTVEFS